MREKSIKEAMVGDISSKGEKRPVSVREILVHFQRQQCKEKISERRDGMQTRFLERLDASLKWPDRPSPNHFSAHSLQAHDLNKFPLPAHFPAYLSSGFGGMSRGAVDKSAIRPQSLPAAPYLVNLPSLHRYTDQRRGSVGEVFIMELVARKADLGTVRIRQSP